jgi:hypothetical protein
MTCRECKNCYRERQCVVPITSKDFNAFLGEYHQYSHEPIGRINTDGHCPHFERKETK